MKRNAIGALMTVIVALVLNASVALAQSAPTKADVPFSFRVNGQSLPAGHYEIRQVGDRATLIASVNGQSKVIGLFNHCETVKMQEPKLVFHKVDGHYFLSQVWMHQSENGLEVPASNLEKELRMSYNQVPAGAETVVIALR